MSKINSGIGITFPIKLDSKGKISLSSYEKDIKESILLILGTAKGERIMHPDFGCSMYDYVFAHLDVSTMELIKASVETSLSLFEPRIEITNISVKKDEKNQNILIISINYEIIATGNQYNLIYPFSMEG